MIVLKLVKSKVLGLIIVKVVGLVAGDESGDETRGCCRSVNAGPCMRRRRSDSKLMESIDELTPADVGERRP